MEKLTSQIDLEKIEQSIPENSNSRSIPKWDGKAAIRIAEILENRLGD